ncbi:MAG: hypothetical protein HYX34_11985 [Actinobacteria bacterium]|nr:hypothetical protein [Actinomycetota bacterium]
MRMLLIESEPSAGDAVAAGLVDTGHTLVRCHPQGAAAFPCVALQAARVCPLDTGDVDVTVTVRNPGASAVSAGEAGVTCSMRRGVPVVAVGDPHDAFSGLATRAGPGEDVAAVCGRAVAAANDRLTVPVRREVDHMLESAGLAGTESRVEVFREGPVLRLRVLVDPATPAALRNVIAVRAHGVLRRTAVEAAVIDIAVGDR